MTTRPSRPPMPASPYGHAFNGRSNDALEVQSETLLRRAEDVPRALAPFVVETMGKPAGLKSVEEVLGISDDGALFLSECVVRASGDHVQVLTAFFGDTRVGFVAQDGRMVARIEDGGIE